MRCTRCGNENPEGNRFCGMCGNTLLAGEVPVSQTQRAAIGSTAPTSAVTTPVRPRTAEPTRPAPSEAEIPSISGPSFLGLSDPAPRKRVSLSADPDSSSSRNLDYLLEDDEPRSGGAGKIFLIIIALALAVGFGYLRWKNHGMDWLKGVTSKPSATAPDSSANQSAPSPAPTSITPEAQTPPATEPAGAAAAPAKSTPNGNDAANSAAPPASQDAAAANAPKTNAPPNTAAGADNAAPESTAKEPAAENAAKQPTDATADDNSDESDTSSDKPAAKPPAAAKPVKTADPVAEAQKYLYGRGAAQDCDRGMRLLKPAANQGNSKAMVEMGALYSAGLCTPHDLPTAYRWFALALRKDPSNQSVQTDLQKLWGEMTQPERQLAIKLTQ